jgi:hypothetical protein
VTEQLKPVAEAVQKLPQVRLLFLSSNSLTLKVFTVELVTDKLASNCNFTVLD